MSSSLDLSELEKRINYTFIKQEYLITALTHRSAHKQTGLHDYERLEYLGDAVLDLAVAHLLIEEHPMSREGELSKMRAALVNTQSLAMIAQELHLAEYVILSRAEKASGGAHRQSLLADLIESVIGAIYRDSGFDSALAVARQLFAERIKEVVPEDPKTELQEYLHALSLPAPLYLLERAEGPEHAPTFVTIVQIDQQIFGRGSGSTKKASQQAAASEALSKLKALHEQEPQVTTELKDE